MPNKVIRFILASVIFVISDVSATEVNALHKLFDLDWQARLERDPSMATQMGKTDADHLLIDVSEEAYQKWAEKTQFFLQQLHKIDYDSLERKEQINYQIFEEQLERRISEIRFKSYQIPFLSDSGFHVDILRLANNMPFKNHQNYLNYLSRLKAAPKFIQQNIDNMRNGLKRNFSMPKIVMKGFSDVIATAYQGKITQSPFWKPFNKFPESISKSQQKQLKNQAEKIIKNELIPAYKSLYTFFEKEYIPNTKESLAAYDFPNGKEYYAEEIKYYTTVNLSAEEIHEIGLNEVARIRGEMEEIIKSLDYQGSFKDFVQFLRTSPQFYAKSEKELIKEASYIAKKMDGELPKLFTHLPRQPYTIKPVPASIAPKYTTGRYVPAPLDSERPGTYWVNTFALNDRPLYVLEALTLHEAVPGHHLQNALNKELGNLPNFRRFSYISAFGEGWGLYSEKLGLEVGFYQDAYSNFGRLTYEMWRAARLVIDTGIHAKGWTREQAIALLENNSALSSHNIRTEVDRYISWPGQALSYKLGEIKIKELRARAEEQLGDKFDIRTFHDEILKNGSIPLSILEEQMEQYIKAKL